MTLNKLSLHWPIIDKFCTTYHKKATQSPRK